DDKADRRVAVRLGGSQLVPHLAAGHAPVLGLHDDPELAPRRQRRVERQDEIALLGTAGVARLRAAALEDVLAAPGDVAEQLLEAILDAGALGRRPRALAGPRRLGGLDRGEPLLDRREALLHLDAELVERRVEASGVEELRQARAVAVEVA